MSALRALFLFVIQFSLSDSPVGRRKDFWEEDQWGVGRGYSFKVVGTYYFREGEWHHST